MKGERLTEELARGLAAPTRRRTVLAALVVGLLVPAGTGEGPVLAAAADRRRRVRNPRCRRDRQCRLGEACDRGRCREADGTAGQFQRCRRSADCDTSEQPLVCELSWGCGGGECMEPGDCSASRRCVGGYDAATATGAQCVESCECAEDLECVDNQCRPRAGH